MKAKIVMAVALLIYCTQLQAQKAQAQRPQAQNLILITLDGMRWQEIFRGADSSFIRTQQAHLKDSKLKEKYWRDNVLERRKALMPFLWTTIERKGQLIGNRDTGSNMNVTNQMWFSYPGYNELLTGQADDARINSNDQNYNPNITVLEIINQQPSFKGKVVAFTSWDCFPYIINDKRSGVVVNSGVKPSTSISLTEAEKTLNKLMVSLPNYTGETRPDALTFYYGLEHIKKYKPRVVFFSFDETDHFAHGGEYGAYLNSAHATDAMIEELWNYLQSETQYKGKTTLLITVDHGRGTDAEAWKHHGIKIKEADQIWMAAIGPGVEAQGEAKNSEPVFQNQVAGTMANLLGVAFTNAGGQSIKLSLTKGK
jgi:Type I phosphodiesterase / nucleotide pyrophosphatase